MGEGILPTPFHPGEIIVEEDPREGGNHMRKSRMRQTPRPRPRPERKGPGKKGFKPKAQIFGPIR